MLTSFLQTYQRKLANYFTSNEILKILQIPNKAHGHMISIRMLKYVDPLEMKLFLQKLQETKAHFRYSLFVATDLNFS